MYRKVMVPLDGSRTAECALPHVQAVVSGCSVPDVVLLRVIASIMPVASGDGYIMSASDRVRLQSEHWAEVEGYLQEVAKRLGHSGVSVKTDTVEGDVTESIIDYADKHGVDLIVMATHGRTGIGRFMMGSVAERVVRHSNVPVLLVRAKKDAHA